MRVLIYIGSHDNNSINAAYKRLDAGDDVTIVSCDKALGICRDNFYGNKLFCKLCMSSNANLWKKDFINKGAKILYLSDIISKEDKENAANYALEYNDLKGLKSILYKECEIGYGAFSTYVSLTRNVMPDITKEFKKYENFLMRRCIETIDAIDRLIAHIHPELIIFHNGRFAEFKPILGLARYHKINFMAVEEMYSRGRVLERNFINTTVHDIEDRFKKILDNWDAGAQTEEEKIKIAKSYFEKKRNKIEAGDTIYTKDQIKGLLPEGFSKDKEIITIFNSSENEYCSVSSVFDSYMLYENQYIGLKSIFDHYKNDKTKHFYLRIHPHLKGLPYKSHTRLYELKYDNVTIIPPSSPVDSYVLMDKSDKIIVFNSTMAGECAYWGKPVVELNKHFWTLMGLVYTPTTENELWGLIDNKNLKCLYNDNCLKYAYWILNPNYEEEKYIHFKDITINAVVKKVKQRRQFMKTMGSVKLNSIIKIILTKKNVAKLLKPFTYFTSLPCTIN